MGQPRADTRPVCGTTNNGFIQQINWALVGDGEHEAVAYDNGVEFDRAAFRVGSTGEEFLTDVTRQTVVADFPAPGDTTVLEWNESTQHFEIRAGWTDGRPVAYDRAWWRQYNEDGYNYDLGVRTYWEPAFLYAEAPDVDTCRPGRLTPAAQARALEAMNQIRALHGLEPVQYSHRYDQQVQEAALIQVAAGFLNHHPEPSAKCYTEAGAEGSRTSNLYRGGGSRDWHADSARYMVGWTNDARNLSLVAAVGHRRWMLNPFADYMSYGQVRGYSAQKVFGFDTEPAFTPTVAVDFVAFPFEVYPFNLVLGDPPWSFSVIENTRGVAGNRYAYYFETATVTVTRTSDGGRLITSNRYTDTRGYGVPNVLSWQVEGWEYDTVYEVEISGVVMQSGETRNYSYPVFIERAGLHRPPPWEEAAG